MSSMAHKTLTLVALLAGAALAQPLAAQSTGSSPEFRTTMVAMQPGQIAQSIERWNYLRGQQNLDFSAYANFISAHPGFPQQAVLQQRAEAALDRDPVGPETLVAFFDRNPPLTNPAKARYALALATQNRAEAFAIAQDAWRGGTMSGPAEAYLEGLYGARFSAEDHDARMNALLWQGDSEGAARHAMRVSPSQRDLGMARLALLQGTAPSSAGLSVPDDARSDPGYVYNLVRYYRTSNQIPQAVALLTSRPTFTRPAFNGEAMIGEMLRVARGASSDQAARIAGSVDDLFAPGYDVSKGSYRLRDDYTSLMWLGGTSALWNMGDGARAAPLFYRYGAAAETPQTRSKGFYWAGLAASRAGMAQEAERYFNLAAQYPDRFYGQLAHKELGRPIPSLQQAAVATPTDQQRREFATSPLVAATRHVAQGAPWSTGIQFYRELAQSADTPEEHALVAELAREIGRRDLAVNVAEAAGADGHDAFVAQGFPTLPLPPGTNFTLVHAITRQESQFAQNAISHAGATGLMQLMPGTAREEAERAGMTYMNASLISDADYNIRLGSNHIERLVARYDGSYPLAFAAYNAGPGNVNKWLRANGDPRTGAIGWLEWIEKIPFFETKNYVHRVIENAAVYEQLHPERAPYGRARTVSDFLR